MKSKNTKKTKNKIHHKIVKFPALGYAIVIVFTDNLEKTNDKLSRYLGRSFDNVDDAAAISRNDPKAAVTYIVFRLNNLTPKIISHESWHAIYAMFHYVGADFENEMVAYHLGHLVEEVHKFKEQLKLKEHKGK